MILRKLYLRLTGDAPCALLVETVTEYLEGTMPARERARFERHLAACASCVDYVAQLRRAIALSGRITVDDVDTLPEKARQELLDAFREFHAAR